MAIRVPVEMDVNEKRVDVSLYREVIDRALTDDTLQTCAEKLGKRLRSFGGPDKAAALIEHESVSRQ